MHSAPVQTQLNDAPASTARFGHSHGYRLEGDAALLNAQIDVSAGARPFSSFALQLWACPEPYRGGPLSGFKVAEAPIALSEHDSAAQLDAVAFARPPAATGEYAMVLVLAAGAQGVFDQVHDFANYPARQRFVVPHLSGHAGYKLHEDGSLSLHAQRVTNPRGADNLSGTLSLQLWASDEPYAGGELKGVLLASHELGQLRGQESIEPGELRFVPTSSVVSARQRVLALCEWTALGYLARDYCNFEESAPAAPEAPVKAIAPEAPVKAITPEAPVKAPAAQAESALPSLNAIDEQALASLAGISAKLAAQVIKARPFKSFDQLRSVRGIGDKTVSRLRKLMTLN